MECWSDSSVELVDVAVMLEFPSGDAVWKLLFIWEDGTNIHVIAVLARHP